MTIGGSDSAGSAAIQVDLKTFQRFDLHAASVITCVTAQNSLVVTHVEPFSCYSVGQQNEAVFSDLVIPALKFGMLYPSEIVDAGESPGV
uniref:bifunctional hydroxymethylpyrimidine kinase/phosphomethylpyrimidine kinase n=1 Tax=Synechococcus sp. UW106 TaxID=368495 RepID=UPI000E0EB03B